MSSFDIGQLVTMACVLESSAPKPGNVHPGASFEDVTFADFVTSAVAIGPAFRQAGTMRVGEVVARSLRATRDAIGTNTNLGTVLLLAPLAAVPAGVPCKEGIGRVLEQLDATDCRDVYEAIRAAKPGGLGEATAADVHEAPPDDLLAAMSLAAERDLVARQYAHGFVDIWEFVLPTLVVYTRQSRSISEAIVLTHLATMARYPDSLIGRKCGAEIAAQSARQAEHVLALLSESDSDEARRELAAFDCWLREGKNQRNPGTTADLLAAALFVKLRENVK